MTSPGLLTKLIGGLIFLLFLFFVFRASKSHQEQQLRITQLMNQMMIENEKINSTKPTMEIISIEPVPMENTSPTSAVPSSVPMENTSPVSEEVVEEAMVISTNGRCGPSFNDTRCPGKQCCSLSHWCAGTQGTPSAWCFKDGKGQELGKYDGRTTVPSPVPMENTSPTSAVPRPVPMENTSPVSEEVVEEAMVISTNGRCGPINSARGLEAITRCPGKECCSRSYWCAGTQGTGDVHGWCFMDGKGQELGKYDGLG